MGHRHFYYLVSHCPRTLCVSIYLDLFISFNTLGIFSGQILYVFCVVYAQVLFHFPCSRCKQHPFCLVCSLSACRTVNYFLVLIWYRTRLTSSRRFSFVDSLGFSVDKRVCTERSFYFFLFSFSMLLVLFHALFLGPKTSRTMSKESEGSSHPCLVPYLGRQSVLCKLWCQLSVFYRCVFRCFLSQWGSSSLFVSSWEFLSWMDIGFCHVLFLRPR